LVGTGCGGGTQGSQTGLIERSFEGTILSADSGLGIEGATVVPVSLENGSDFEATTDAQGKFLIQLELANDAQEVQFLVEKGQQLSASFAVTGLNENVTKVTLVVRVDEEANSAEVVDVTLEEKEDSGSGDSLTPTPTPIGGATQSPSDQPGSDSTPEPTASATDTPDGNQGSSTPEPTPTSPISPQPPTNTPTSQEPTPTPIQNVQPTATPTPCQAGPLTCQGG